MHTTQLPERVTHDSFSKLALSFETTPENDLITLSPSMGTGVLKRLHVTNGLEVIIWDIQLQEPLHLQRQDQFESHKGFHIYYPFTREAIRISDQTNVDGREKDELKNIVFASADTILNFDFQPSRPVRMLEMIITDEWLSTEYAINSRLPYPFYAIIMKQKEAVLFTEPAFCTAYNLLLDIFKNTVSDTPDSFYTRTKTLSLLSDVFESVGNRNTPGYNSSVVMHEKMIAVEKILADHVKSTLPSIQNIARSVALSESTLKRNFKALYGTTIYEYYLQQKMKKARELFEENPRTVKEVAYMLGYEKVSNFIQMFKKHYHFLPGNLKKMHRMQQS